MYTLFRGFGNSLVMIGALRIARQLTHTLKRRRSHRLGGTTTTANARLWRRIRTETLVHLSLAAHTHTPDWNIYLFVSSFVSITHTHTRRRSALPPTTICARRGTNKKMTNHIPKKKGQDNKTIPTMQEKCMRPPSFFLSLQLSPCSGLNTHTHRIVTRLHVSDPEEKAQEEGWEGRGEREREEPLRQNLCQREVAKSGR